MKKLFILAATGFLFATGSYGQVQRPMRPHGHVTYDSSANFHHGQMMEQLNLTADQKTQMKALHEDMMQQRKSIEADSSLSAEQKKAKMHELHKSQMEKMKGILTPEQQEKLKTLRQQRNENAGMRNRNSGMMKQLDVNAQQQSQLKALHETMNQQRNAIQNDNSLSTEQKQEKMKEWRKSRKEQMEAILTPAQQAKMKALGKQHHENRPHQNQELPTSQKQS